MSQISSGIPRPMSALSRPRSSSTLETTTNYSRIPTRGPNSPRNRSITNSPVPSAMPTPPQSQPQPQQRPPPASLPTSPVSAQRPLHRAPSLSVSVASLASSFDAAARMASAAAAPDNAPMTSTGKRSPVEEPVVVPQVATNASSRAEPTHLCTTPSPTISEQDGDSGEKALLQPEMPPTPAPDTPDELHASYCSSGGDNSSGSASNTGVAGLPANVSMDEAARRLDSMAPTVEPSVSTAASSPAASLRIAAALATSLPADVEYLTSIPVSQWSHADVADFFRATLSLPLDMSNETAQFIVENDLSGAQLARMSELDLRRSGVNTQWCQRLVSTLALVKERQHRRRLQLQEDGDISLAAYIETQFTQQLALLQQTVEVQERLESVMLEQTSRSTALAQRITRLEQALAEQVTHDVELRAEHQRQMNEIKATYQEVVAAGKSRTLSVEPTEAAVERRVPNPTPPEPKFPYLAVGQSLAAGIALGMVLLRVLR